MNTFYTIIDAIADFARKNIRYESLLWKILRFFQNILHIKDYSPFKKKKFRENDIFFESILDKLGENKLDAFFVFQIGACDGIMADPIYHKINKYGWSALLVEPQKSEFENLKLNYIKNKNIKLENVAISDSIGHRKLYKLEDNEIAHDWQRGTASFLDKPRFGSFEIVKCVTFDEILNENQINEIDLLQIDVEGYDFELLKLFDFERLKPSLIRYEHKHLNFSDKILCTDLLEKHGYFIIEMQKDTGAILRTFLKDPLIN